MLHMAAPLIHAYCSRFERKTNEVGVLRCGRGSGSFCTIAPEYGYDPVPFFAICLYGLTGIARLLFIGYEGFGGEYFQNSPQPITGCLTVLGITAGYHTVGFCRVESFAKCCLQRAEGGKSLGRQMVAEAGACVGSCSRAASISRSIACMSKLPDG